MSRRTVSTDRAPAAIGPYSQGVIGCGLLYTSMQIALDPATGEMVGATAAEQAQQCLKNIQAVVEAAGRLLAVAGHERDGGPLVQEGYGGGDLSHIDAQLGGDRLGDAAHGRGSLGW